MMHLLQGFGNYQASIADVGVPVALPRLI